MATTKSFKSSEESVCRLCLKSSDVLVSIFSDETRLSDFIIWFVNIEEKITDGLPQFICQTCLLELQHYRNLKLKCQESNSSLRSMLVGLGDQANNTDNYSLDSEWAVCRVCLEGAGTLQGIFADGDQIKNDILYFAGVTVTVNDGLPQSICEECLLGLQLCLQFIQICEETDYSLRTFLKMETILHKKPVKPTNDTDAMSTVKESNLNPNQCQICRKILNSRQAYLVHARAHRIGRPFVCEHCGLAFALPATLRKHIRIHEEVFPYECALCPYRARVRHGLTLHIRSHTGEKPFPCPHCDKAFTTSSGRSCHLLVHNSNLPRTRYHCKECPKVYVSQRNLLDHVSTSHRRVKRHKCDVCGKRLATSTSLKQHERRIHDIDPVSVQRGRIPMNLHQHLEVTSEPTAALLCDQCTDVFPTETELLQHFEAKHKPLRCHICMKVFNKRKNYWEHMRAHKNKGRTFICELCGQSFTHLSSLKKHRGIHQGARPFQCSHCPYSARLKHLLKTHMRVHTKKAKKTCIQYNCLHCPSIFGSQKARSMHILKDHPLYQCKECQKTYTKMEALVNHTCVVHKIKIEPNEHFAKNFEVYKGVTHDSSERAIRSYHKEEQLKKNESEMILNEAISEFKLDEKNKMQHKTSLVDIQAKYFSCEQCTSVYKDAKTLMEHVSSVHNKVEKVKCRIRKKEFMSEMSLERHQSKGHKQKRNNYINKKKSSKRKSGVSVRVERISPINASPKKNGSP